MTDALKLISLNLREDTIDKLKTLGTIEDRPYTVIARRALEVLTNTGHANPDHRARVAELVENVEAADDGAARPKKAAANRGARRRQRREHAIQISSRSAAKVVRSSKGRRERDSHSECDNAPGRLRSPPGSHTTPLPYTGT